MYVPDVSKTQNTQKSQSLSFTLRGAVTILYYYGFPDITELLVICDSQWSVRSMKIGL